MFNSPSVPRFVSILAISLIIEWLLLACSTPTPTDSINIMTHPAATSSDISTPTPSPMQELFKYIPYEWADQHPAALMGPPILFLDFARMRDDLGLPAVGEADSQEVRLDLTIGMITQGLDWIDPMIQLSLQPMSSGALVEWGWDVTDVTQAVYIPGAQTSILVGDFWRPEVKERLLTKGYVEEELGELSVFAADDSDVQFAVKPDILIVSPTESILRIFVDAQLMSGISFAQHPSVEPFYGHVEGAWGALFAPSGDLAAYDEQMQERRREYPEGVPSIWDVLDVPDVQAVPYAWDCMLIAFWGSDQETVIHILYHYPSQETASADVELARTSLTESPSFQYRARTWADMINLESVEVQMSVLVARATTRDKSFIGNAFKNRDYYGFLPIRTVPVEESDEEK